MSRVLKAVPVLLREKRGVLEVLAFRHPKAGLQIVKGTIEDGEPPEAAALRELKEESGVADARLVGSLGTSESIADGEVWHFFRCEADEQPVRWVFATADGNGLIFSFFWHPLEAVPDHEWHPKFVRALEHIRAALSTGV